mmetsp:Transcript_62025/g.145505  ORF Transcript_62025/g.145505 Transcript_62025/m.145505 type:complete len:371 (+) Transcript_62025:1777-2889(+)
MNVTTIAEQQHPSHLPQIACNFNGTFAQIVCSSLTIKPTRRSLILHIAVLLRGLPEPRLVHLAALALIELLQLLGCLRCIVQAVDFHVALISQLDHDMLLAVLHEGVVSENHLLLSHTPCQPIVPTRACQQCPRTLLGHEVDKLHRLHTHVVLPLRPSLFEGAGGEFEVTVVFVGSTVSRTTPFLSDEALELPVNPIRIIAIHFYVSDRPQLDHDVRRHQIQGMGSLKLDLRLTHLAVVPQISTICQMQAPSTLVGHKVDDLHSQLSHVVFSLVAAAFEFAIAVHRTIRILSAARIILITNFVTRLFGCHCQLRSHHCSAAVVLIYHSAHHQRGLCCTKICLEEAVKFIIDTTYVLATHLNVAHISKLDQ